MSCDFDLKFLDISIYMISLIFYWLPTSVAIKHLIISKIHMFFLKTKIVHIQLENDV